MTTLRPRVHESAGSRLVAYDHGAHLAEWTVDGEPVLWLSERAVLDGSAPIRGGIPICFPWFAAGPDGDLSPSHGPVRGVPWRPAPPADEDVWAWELTSGELAGAPGSQHLPGAFALRYAVSLRAGADPQDGPPDGPALGLALTVTNPADVPLRAEAALHTYLAVADVERARVVGLEDVGYWDKVHGRRGVQEGQVTLGAETDRVYDSPGRPGLLVLDGRREIGLHPTGATRTVVWNPWSDKAASMDDVAEGAWRRFLCVETAATGDGALVVPPGSATRLTCTVTVRRPPPA